MMSTDIVQRKYQQKQNGIRTLQNVYTL